MLIKNLSFIVLSCVATLGMYCSNFSVFSIIALIAPALGSSLFGFMIMTAIVAKKVTFTSLSTFTLLKVIKIFYLPTLCATLCWVSYTYRVTMALIALGCMPLFWLHPVGYEAALYAGFWLIPYLTLFIKPHSIISQALASTFVAHALGSVLFIWATPHTSTYWLGLIPHVIIERSIALIGMIVVYHAQQLIFRFLGILYQSIFNKITKILAIKNSF